MLSRILKSVISPRVGICFLVALMALLVAPTTHANDPKYYLGFQSGIIRAYGGESAFYPFQHSFEGFAGLRLDARWTAELQLGFHDIYNDPAIGSSLQFTPDKDASDRLFSVTRIGAVFSRDMFAPESNLNIGLGIGGGLALWEVLDPTEDTLVKVQSRKGDQVVFQAPEIMFTGQAALKYRMSRHVGLRWMFRLDYLSSVGTEFAEAVMDRRATTMTASMLSLSIAFGRGSEWKSEQNWASRPAKAEIPVSRYEPDGDGDGVPDSKDRCPNTPRGVIVDPQGCSRDSDFDGVPDGLDDCPGTDRRARGTVDINGCAVDSDYDGVPDYADACPFNITGAEVGADGCPLDDDQDGVPNGLDDCPHTLIGMEVDRHGCVDLSMLDAPLVLNIDYVSGSFEVDPHTREKLKRLAGLLVFVTDVRLEISGYTDNIGTATANQQLSAKRARRVRDYLVSLGVDETRITAIGRGETNFVKSNETAAGRAANRRVEIVFYR